MSEFRDGFGQCAPFAFDGGRGERPREPPLRTKHHKARREFRPSKKAHNLTRLRTAAMAEAGRSG